jgi:DNA (cytosine-5)-methyltransferase 1
MGTLIGTVKASKLIGISTQMVRRLCQDKILTASKISNRWIINNKSVTSYIDSKKTIIDHPSNIELNKVDKPIAISFFSGAMGLDIGLENAGFKIILACENDKFCRQTIESNRPGTALLDDINNVAVDDIYDMTQLSQGSEIDLMVGGPPCQAFSTAGKRKGFNDTRGNVFLKYLDLAFEIRPKYLVIENVRGLLSSPMLHRPHDKRGDSYPELSLDEMRGGALNFIINRIEASGYGYSFNLYNSAYFGTPQTRERVIIICSRDGKNPPYLVPTHSNNKEDGLHKWKTFKDATQNLKTHDHLNFPEKRLQFYNKLKPGENWRSLPEKLQKEALGNSYYAGGGKTGFFRRLAWNKPSPTLVTHPAMPATDLCHPEDDRPLSIQEYLAIQQFPKNWILKGPLTEQYKQVGNAVPIGLGEAVGKLILNLLDGSQVINDHRYFKYSRYKNTNDKDWKGMFEQLKSKHAQLSLI